MEIGTLSKVMLSNDGIKGEVLKILADNVRSNHTQLTVSFPIVQLHSDALSNQQLSIAYKQFVQPIVRI
jgi:hypothetical protein